MIYLIGYPDFTPEVYTYDAKLMVQALLVDGHLLHLLFIPLPFLSILIYPPRDVLLREHFPILHLEIWSWIDVKYERGSPTFGQVALILCKILPGFH